MQLRKLFWVSISTESKNHLARGGEAGVPSNGTKRLDSHRAIKLDRNPIQGIRIDRCKNPPCLHSYPGWPGPTIPVQQDPTAPHTSSSLPASKPCPTRSHLRLQDPPQGVFRLPHQVPRASRRMARFYWGMRRLVAWSWGCYLWGEGRVHSHSFPVGMANGGQATVQGRTNYQL